MIRPPGLTASEAALWQRVAATVAPFEGRMRDHRGPQHAPLPPAGGAEGGPVDPTVTPNRPSPGPSRKREGNLDRRTLDAAWDRRLARGHVAPDAEVDLHGLGLDAAHARLMTSLANAQATGARVVLVIAGKPRPHGETDQRGQRRGAIRAKLVDWLAASEHAGRIAAIRPAHPRHGGAGAVYVVLRRPSAR